MWQDAREVQDRTEEMESEWERHKVKPTSARRGKPIEEGAIKGNHSAPQ